MRLSIRASVLCSLAAAAACAKIAPPPGGPPDAIAPVLLATRPDSIGIYPEFKGNAEFIFDETISEGSVPNLGYGNGDLERLVILSPSDKAPHVSWQRSRIAVRPRDGWRPNTVYRIELLPGITDLRRNREKGSQVLTFTTGAPLPTDSLDGIVIDWGARQVVRQGMIEAILLPDSLTYRTQSDSSGRFRLAPLPHGSYLLRAFVDQNKNRRLDGKEVWDSLGVLPAPSAHGVFWLAERDTFPPRLTTAAFRDSQTVDLTLSQPFDPAQQLDTSNVRIRLLPDSVVVPVVAFRPRALDDTLTERARAHADSIRADSVQRARPDTAHKAMPKPPVAPPVAPPTPTAGRGRRPTPVDSTVIRLLADRPLLSDRLVVRVAASMPPEAKYLVEIRGIRNLNGASGTAINGFTVPKPPPPPKAATDSTRHDSTATRPVPRPGTRPPPGRP